MSAQHAAEIVDATSREISALAFNPLAPEVIADPYPYYDRLRAVDPVFKAHFDSWFLTRYADVAFVLRDRRFGKDFARGRGAQMSNEPALVAMSRMLIYLDPPDHTRVRGLFAHGASVKRVEELRAFAKKIADELIDRAAPHGRMDIVSEYAVPLSLQVVSEFLGIPTEDRAAFFAHLPPTLGRTIDVPQMSRRDLDEANARTRYFENQFLPLIDLRRRHPSGDFISDLVRAQAERDELSDLELISNVTLLFNAGYETTANLIGNSMLALYQHCDELARVKRDASAIRDGMDELLRYGASVQFGGRTALEDVEIGGKLIRKGDSVITSIGAANRDPAVFADPHRLDLTRRNVRPLSFGGGIHFCLGAQMARMEIEIALTTLLRRLPSLDLDLDGLRWKRSFIFRGLQSLPTSW